MKQYFYTPHNLHAKVLMVDGEVFAIGSPNFDYRSFRFQHEIVMIGIESSVSQQLEIHINETLENSIEFDYNAWKKRSAMQKFFEWILLPFRHLL